MRMEVIYRMLNGSKKARRIAWMWLDAKNDEERKEIEEKYKDVFEDYSGEPHSI